MKGDAAMFSPMIHYLADISDREIAFRMEILRLGMIAFSIQALPNRDWGYPLMLCVEV